MQLIRFFIILLIGLTLGMAIFDWHFGEKINAFWMLGLGIINMQALIMSTNQGEK